jgi:hypothetical protein
MNPFILTLAFACGFQQVPVLDAYGNETCRDAPTGTTRSIEGSLSDCPTGTMPLLTDQGPACVGKDDGVRYFDLRRECPIGTVRMLDARGNEVCR